MTLERGDVKIIKLYICSVFLFALLLVMPVYSMDEFKISEYGGGHQIWFEAEAFDARDTDSENRPNVGFKLVDEETNIGIPGGAFGDAIVNIQGNSRIWLLYNFDISECGGKAGTWYLWPRMINPGNKSEWLWVKGDDGDEIPDSMPLFVTEDDRAFEQTIGPPWGWSRGNEGETKNLQDGENTMMVWFREGDATALRDVLVWSDTLAYRPTDDGYRNAEAIRKEEPVESSGKLATAWGKLKDK